MDMDMDRGKTELASTSEEYIPLPPLPPRPYLGSLPAVHYGKGLIKGGDSYRGHCCGHRNSWDLLFDEGYRSDVLINTDHGGVIYAHANVLGFASPVFRSILKQSRGRRGRRLSISIRGAPPEAVHVFIRFLYSSCFDEEKLEEYALQLLVLSHAYAVPQLKRVCEERIQRRLITSENAIDIFQVALLCDASRLSFLCHRFILRNFKAVFATDAWKAMKESHPVLEKRILESVAAEDMRLKERTRKINERKVYAQLYEAMEALVHICRDGCRTIGPHDKVLKDYQETCNYEDACKGLELLLRHFAGCKKRVRGGCIHCNRMWQLFELHSRLCADSDVCRVPLCGKFKQSKRQNKKNETKWRILVKKIVRSKSISGGPFFSLESAFL